MGGPVPLGYGVSGKKLLAHPTEAEQVRTIFSRYLELESLTVLMQDLARRGIGTKERHLSSGATRGGTAFGKGALAYLLRNPIYLGEIRHQGRTYRGEPPRPVPPALKGRNALRGYDGNRPQSAGARTGTLRRPCANSSPECANRLR